MLVRDLLFKDYSIADKHPSVLHFSTNFFSLTLISLRTFWGWDSSDYYYFDKSTVYTRTAVIYFNISLQIN